MKKRLPGTATAADSARELLLRLGLKATISRLEIVRLLLAHGSKMEHVSAEQIYRELQAQHRSLGLATIYRTLAVLETQGAVKRKQFSRGQTVFELTGHRVHHHMVETSGRAVLEFSDAKIERRLQQLAAAQGYDYVGSELVVYVKPRLPRSEPAQGRAA